MRHSKSLFLLIASILLLFVEKSFASDVNADTVYVVEVKTHSNVKVIESAKKSLMGKYPDKKFIIRSQSSNYILSIGYFATKDEAEEFQKKLEEEYPNTKVLPVEKK